jgi:hypothetical protein
MRWGGTALFTGSRRWEFQGGDFLLLTQGVLLTKASHCKTHAITRSESMCTPYQMLNTGTTIGNDDGFENILKAFMFGMPRISEGRCINARHPTTAFHPANRIPHYVYDGCEE